MGDGNLKATTSLCKNMHIFDVAQPHPYERCFRTLLNKLTRT